MFYWKLGSELSFLQSIVTVKPCLNPCFTGSWVLSGIIVEMLDGGLYSLNPCFTGSWVLRMKRSRQQSRKCLGLNPCFTGSWVLSENLKPGNHILLES